MFVEIIIAYYCCTFSEVDLKGCKRYRVGRKNKIVVMQKITLEVSVCKALGTPINNSKEVTVLRNEIKPEICELFE